MRVVVADTGPLVHLGEAQVLRVLRTVGEIHIPETVERELSQLINDWPSNRRPWVRVSPLDSSYAAEARAWEQARLLDRGEADAISLARQLSGSWLLTDDASARLMAEALGIEVHGSLGVVLWAASQRELTRVEAEAALNSPCPKLVVGFGTGSRRGESGASRPLRLTTH